MARIIPIAAARSRAQRIYCGLLSSGLQRRGQFFRLVGGDEIALALAGFGADVSVAAEDGSDGCESIWGDMIEPPTDRVPETFALARRLKAKRSAMRGPMMNFFREAIMSKIAIIIVATLGLSALVFAAEPATTPQDAKDAQIKALQAKVREQEAIIRDLSQKLAQTQASPPLTLKYGSPQTMQALPKPVPQQIPQGWVRREFNGTAFYLIPLAK